MGSCLNTSHKSASDKMAALTSLLIVSPLFGLCFGEAVYIPPYGERLNPKQFQYEYGVSQPESKVSFVKKEKQDLGGNVLGEVVVLLPDGRTQTTIYSADHQDGYEAEVKYDGSKIQYEYPQIYQNPSIQRYKKPSPQVITSPKAPELPRINVQKKRPVHIPIVPVLGQLSSKRTKPKKDF